MIKRHIEESKQEEIEKEGVKEEKEVSEAWNQKALEEEEREKNREV